MENKDPHSFRNFDELQRLIRELRPFSEEERRAKLEEWKGKGDIAEPVYRELKDFFHPAPAAKLEIGGDFGKYKITDLLGEGGMGRVYQAWDPDLGRNVAIKLIRPDLVGLEKEFHGQGLKSPQELFREETAVLASLQHAGIVSIYERGIVTGPSGSKIPYCAMEKVDGEPLTVYCQNRRLDADHCLGIMAQVAEAVGYAHNRKVVHRDLKPANILIDSSGQPRILDFGIALVMDKSSLMDALALGLGTPEYLSPEQLSHKFGRVGYASDVYALGVIIYELLAKRRPYYPDPGRSEFQEIILKEVPKKLGQLDQSLSGKVEEVVETCLKKLPADRYPNSNALADNLRICMEERRFRMIAKVIVGGKTLETPSSPLPPLPENKYPAKRSASFDFGMPTVPIGAGNPANPAARTPGSARLIPPTQVIGQREKPAETFGSSRPVADPAGSSRPAFVPSGGAAALSRYLVVAVCAIISIVGLAVIIPGLMRERKPPMDIDKALQNVAMLFNRGDFPEAARALDAILEEDPDHELALLNRGRAHQLSGDRDKAIQDLEAVLRINPRNQIALQLLSLLQDKGVAQLPPAPNPELTSANKSDPAEVERNYVTGMKNLQEGRFRQAVDYLTQVSNASKNYKEADINLALAHFYLDEHAEALAKFGEVIANNPRANNALNLRGQCYFSMGNMEKAIEDFDAFLKLTPDFSDGYNRRGQALLKARQFDRAIEDFSTYIQKEPESSLGYEFRGRTLIEQGEYTKAIRDLDQAALINPNDADIFAHRSLAFEKLGDKEKAKVDRERALRLDPNALDRLVSSSP